MLKNHKDTESAKKILGDFQAGGELHKQIICLPQEERCTAMLNVVLLALPQSNELARSAPKQSALANTMPLFDTTINGQLEFTQWFIEKSKQHCPTPELMECIRNYRQTFWRANRLTKMLKQFEQEYNNVYLKQITKQKDDYKHPFSCIINGSLPYTWVEFFQYWEKTGSFFINDDDTVTLAQTTYFVKQATTEYLAKRASTESQSEKFKTPDEAFNALGMDKQSSRETFNFLWDMQKNDFLKAHGDMKERHEYELAVARTSSPQEHETAYTRTTTEETKLLSAFQNKYMAWFYLYHNHHFTLNASNDGRISIDDLVKHCDNLDIKLDTPPGPAADAWDRLTERLINLHWKKACLKHHPDRYSTATEPEKKVHRDKFVEITASRDALINYKKSGMSYADFSESTPRHGGAPAHKAGIDSHAHGTGHCTTLVATNAPTLHDESQSHVRAKILLSAKKYLKARRFSAWLVSIGAGFLVRVFSKLRHQKIKLTLQLIRDLTPEAKPHSETRPLLDDSHCTSTTDIAKLLHTHKTNVVEAVKKQKGASIDAKYEKAKTKAYKQKACSVPFFWRFANSDKGYDTAIKNKLNNEKEKCKNQNGRWGQSFPKQ